MATHAVHNYLISDGTIYSGHVMRRGKLFIPHGEGKAVLANKDIYFGGWRKGKPHGLGQMIKQNYSIYIGEFVDGEMHGYGKITFKENPQIKSMDGYWKNNQLDGEACIIYADGSKYCGPVKKFMRHGNGTFYSANDTVMKARWVKNELHGKATITLATHKITCEWEKDKMISKCKIEYNFPGDLTKSNVPKIYRGECDETFRPQGYGTMRYTDGSIYEGYWENGQRSWYGQLRMKSGDYYGGYWHQDKKHGYGIYFSRIGSHAIEYVWENDVMLERTRSYYF